MSKLSNPTNLGRVERMISTLELITISARSNRAEPEDLRAFLAPVVEELEKAGALVAPEAAPVTRSGPPAPKPGQTTATLRDKINGADVSPLELCQIIRLASDRLEEAAFKLRDAEEGRA